jgi:hypothetical protein
MHYQDMCALALKVQNTDASLSFRSSWNKQIEAIFEIGPLTEQGF